MADERMRSDAGQIFPEECASPCCAFIKLTPYNVIYPLKAASPAFMLCQHEGVNDESRSRQDHSAFKYH